jgi:glyoxylase-like metal-dependent hydrolase (beta-lactamase superfamily II)
VDAGISRKNFTRELNKLGIKPKMIKAIFLTHTDGDHIGAINIFKNATIYMSREEEQMINGISGKSKFFKPKWKNGPYTLFEDNDSLDIDGIKVKMLLTKGHTTGSSCFIINNDYFLTGDNLILREGKYEPFTEKFNMNTPQQVESIKTLPSPSHFKYILTGHYGIIKN